MTVEYVYPSQNQHIERITGNAAHCDASLIGAGCPEFADLIDIVNPLQQLPVIGPIYRAISGDEIATGSQLAGGFLFGGPVGLMAAAISAGFEAATGGFGEHLLASAIGDKAEQRHAAAAYQKTSQLG